MKILDITDTLYSEKYEGLRVKFWFAYCPGDQNTSPCEEVQIEGIYCEESQHDLSPFIDCHVIRGLEDEISEHCHKNAA